MPKGMENEGNTVFKSMPAIALCDGWAFYPMFSLFELLHAYAAVNPKKPQGDDGRGPVSLRLLCKRRVILLSMRSRFLL